MKASFVLAATLVAASSLAQVRVRHSDHRYGRMHQPVRQIRQIRRERIVTDRDYLRRELAALETHLREVRLHYGKNSPQSREMNAHIRKLRAQIAADNRRLKRN